MDSRIKLEVFESAEAFLEALRPTHQRWVDGNRDWLFRGHGNSRWPLRPTAFRPECWEKLGGHPGEYCNDQTEEFEIDELLHFARGLDRVGLPIPSMTRVQLAEWDRADHSKVLTQKWIEAFADVMALAQHHGFPTRLLDFTVQPLIAAYFAAIPLAASDPLDEPAESLCVWAVDADRLAWGSDEWCGVVRATRAGNPNLHAQHGVFITWKTPSETLDEIIPKLKDEWGEFRGEDEREEPSAYQLTLPRTESVKLLGLLAREHVTGERLFPGPEGVIRAHYEQKLHWVRPPECRVGTRLDHWHREFGMTGSSSGPEPTPRTKVAVSSNCSERLRLLKGNKARLGETCTAETLVAEALELLFDKHGV